MYTAIEANKLILYGEWLLFGKQMKKRALLLNKERFVIEIENSLIQSQGSMIKIVMFGMLS